MKKQIVFLMTDTTRKDMVGCYGNPKMKTPNLDRLAEEGIRYENAYTCQPVCGPARSAIFTGTFPHSNGMVTNSIAMGANVKTVGQRLSDNGIECGYIGKWHLDGSDYFGTGECPEGWNPDYWYDMKCYLEELSDEDKVKSRDPKESYKKDFSETFTYAHRCSDRAIKYLEEHSNQDFFLTVSYDEPHGPSLCPEPFNYMYDGFKFDSCPNFEDDLSQKPFMQRLWAGKNLHATEEEINKPSDGLSLFLGCNSFVDYEIGRVLDKIREVIGQGGKVIQKIVAETGAKIDIEEDGTIHIFAVDQESGKAAKDAIEAIVKEPEVGEIYNGLVKTIQPFGAFVEILPGKDGLCHISKLANHRVEKVEDVVKEGDWLKVKVMEVDKKTGKISLSHKDAIEEGEE